MPDQMTPAQRAAYRRIFTLIRGNQFAAAAAALNTMPSNGLLTGTGWAALWLAAGSPGASAGALSGSLSTNNALPQAARLAALAHPAGVQAVPALPPTRTFQRCGASGREKTRTAWCGAATSAFAAHCRPLFWAQGRQGLRD